MPEEVLFEGYAQVLSNGMMKILYVGLFLLLAFPVTKMLPNRKSVRLPIHLFLIILNVFLWSVISIARYFVTGREAVYITSLLTYSSPMFTLIFMLSFTLYFHNLNALFKRHILLICEIFPLVSVINILILGLPSVADPERGINLIKTNPYVSTENLNYVFGNFGPWFYVQLFISAAFTFSMVAVALIQHLKLPKIYRAPSEKLMIGTFWVGAGMIATLFNATGSADMKPERLPLDFALIFCIVSVPFFYRATLGNQGLVFLSQARNDIIQHLDQSILVLDEESNIIFKNKKAVEWLTGFQFSSASYPSLTESLAAVPKKYEKLPDEEGGSDYYFDVKGESKVFNLREKPIYDKRNRQIGTYVIYSDVTENRALIQRLEVGAGRDALTGLHNRSMMESLKKELDKPESLPLAILICDVNDLKLTNDVHGHQSGDIMLRVCGEALVERCPPTAQSGRIGGDEFLVLLPQTGKTEAEAVIASIREYLKGIEDYPYKITMAMGCGIKKSENDDIQTALIEADEAMYENKKEIKGAENIRNKDPNRL